MKAGKEFIDDLRALGKLRDVTKITVDVYGSLSLTGKGHHTDIAIIMGLAGNSPEHVDIDSIPGFISRVEETERLPVGMHCHTVDFPRDGGMNFHTTNLSRMKMACQFTHGLVTRLFSLKLTTLLVVVLLLMKKTLVKNKQILLKFLTHSLTHLNC